jgi:hypothetical protein
MWPIRLALLVLLSSVPVRMMRHLFLINTLSRSSYRIGGGGVRPVVSPSPLIVGGRASRKHRIGYPSTSSRRPSTVGSDGSSCRLLTN